MAELTLWEMLRLGGYGAYSSFFLGIIIVVLMALGYLAVAPYARRRPGAPLVRAWGWTILLAGFVCAFNGAVGTLMGMVNIYHAVAPAPPPQAQALLAQGVFEVLFNLTFGFAFAFVALFGYATTRLLAGRG